MDNSLLNLGIVASIGPLLLVHFGCDSFLFWQGQPAPAQREVLSTRMRAPRRARSSEEGWKEGSTHRALNGKYLGATFVKERKGVFLRVFVCLVGARADCLFVVLFVVWRAEYHKRHLVPTCKASRLTKVFLVRRSKKNKCKMLG